MTEKKCFVDRTDDEQYHMVSETERAYQLVDMFRNPTKKIDEKTSSLRTLIGTRGRRWKILPLSLHLHPVREWQYQVYVV